MTSKLSGAECLVVGILAIAFLTFWFLAGAFIFMLAWNAFIAGALGGSAITFGQAVAGWILVSFIGAAFRTTVSSK